MSSERILITGASGFLGKALSQELSNRFEVIPGDRNGAYTPVEYVVDLASYGNAHHEQNISSIYQANIMRLARLVEASRFQPPKGMIFTSSAVVTQPNLGYYGASKLAVEAMAQAVTHCPVVTLRPYTVTGIGDQPHHLIPTLIRSCMEGEQMPFIGSPVHDYIDIDDVVKTYHRVLNGIRRLSGQTLGVGTGVSYSNEQVKQLVEKATGKKANLIRVKGLRAHDHTEWEADTNDMCKIGYIPQKRLVDSIGEMVASYE